MAVQNTFVTLGYSLNHMALSEAIVLKIPVFLLGMSDFFHFLHIQSLVSKSIVGWVELLLATHVVFYCAWEFFKREWSSIIRKNE